MRSHASRISRGTQHTTGFKEATGGHTAGFTYTVGAKDGGSIKYVLMRTGCCDLQAFYKYTVSNYSKAFGRGEPV